jgi:putative flippase GtrA
VSRSPSAGRKTLLGQAVTFGIVGVGTLVLDYATYRGLLLAGAPFSLAKVCGFVLGTAAAYLINRTVTFGHSGGRRAVLSFLLLYAVTLVLNVAVNAVGLRLLEGVTGRITWAFLIAQAVTSTANFFGMRHGVFRPVPAADLLGHPDPALHPAPSPDHESGARRATDPSRPGLRLPGTSEDPPGRGDRA